MNSSSRVLRLRPLVLAATLLLAPLAMAQDGNRIEQQMTAEQFRAAGLDKLDAAELETLNAWLNRTLVTETDKAARQAEDKVRTESRGLFGSGSDEPISARLQGSFEGFAQGRRYTLDNGQVWRQVDGATLPGASMESPQVRITPSLIGSAWYLKVEGYNTRAKVERVK